MPREWENRSEQTKGGISQSEQNCDLIINCSDNLERFWSLKLCILGYIDVLIQMVQLVCLYLVCRVRYRYTYFD